MIDNVSYTVHKICLVYIYFINVRLSCRRTGQAYLELRSTYSIWLLADTLLVDDNAYVHHYKMRDEQGQTLTPHGGIWLLELKKFNANQVETEDQRWLKFFKDGERLNDETLPDWMITQEMRQAMSTLSTFSEKDQQYYQYQARQEYLREQRTIQSELELANKREEAANKREALALAEIERLKALLAQKE